MAGRTSGPGRGPGAGVPGVRGPAGPRAAVAPTVAGGVAIVYTRVASPRPARCAMPARDPDLWTAAASWATRPGPTAARR